MYWCSPPLQGDTRYQHSDGEFCRVVPSIKTYLHSSHFFLFITHFLWACMSQTVELLYQTTVVINGIHNASSHWLATHLLKAQQ